MSFCVFVAPCWSSLHLSSRPSHDCLWPHICSLVFPLLSIPVLLFPTSLAFLFLAACLFVSLCSLFLPLLTGMTQLPGPEESQTFTIICGRPGINLPLWMLNPGPWTPRCLVCKGQNGRVDRQIEGGRRVISLGLTLLPTPGEEQCPQHLGLTPIHLNLVYDLGPSCCAALLP